VLKYNAETFNDPNRKTAHQALKEFADEQGLAFFNIQHITKAAIVFNANAQKEEEKFIKCDSLIWTWTFPVMFSQNFTYVPSL